FFSPRLPAGDGRGQTGRDSASELPLKASPPLSPPLNLGGKRSRFPVMAGPRTPPQRRATVRRRWAFAAPSDGRPRPHPWGGAPRRSLRACCFRAAFRRDSLSLGPVRRHVYALWVGADGNRIGDGTARRADDRDRVGAVIGDTSCRTLGGNCYIIEC